MRPLAITSAVLTVLAALAACSDDAADEAAAADQPSTEISAEPDYTVVGDDVLEGPGRWAMRAFGDPGAPLAVFNVPSVFQGHEIWLWYDVGNGVNREFGQVMYAAPARVPRDPCDPESRAPRIGPTVEDLADALEAQRLTTTTRPVATRLAGQEGVYLEMSVDADALSTCNGDGAVIYKVSGDRARFLDEPAMEQYWILDVDGHRVVLTAMTRLDRSHSSLRRVDDLVESVEFVSPS